MVRPTLDLMLEHDGWRCALCKGRVKARENGSVDHIIPRHHKGTDSMWNAQLAHRLCNVKKGSRLPHPGMIRYEHITKDNAEQARRCISRALSWKYPREEWPEPLASFIFDGTPLPISV